MARGTSEHKGGVFLDIRGGYVCERVNEPGEGIHERTIEKGPNKGAVVYERRDGAVKGATRKLNKMNIAPGRSVEVIWAKPAKR